MIQIFYKIYMWFLFFSMKKNSDSSNEHQGIAVNGIGTSLQENTSNGEDDQNLW